MKDKKQQNEIDTGETRRIANVRVHVERVIGVTRTRFKILKGLININFLIQKMVRILLWIKL